jgi:hypothetical protein
LKTKNLLPTTCQLKDAAMLASIQDVFIHEEKDVKKMVKGYFTAKP